MTMSPGWISGVAFSRSSAVTTSHFSLGIDTTTPVPKKQCSGISSRNGVPSMTWAGTSTWVVECMTVVMRCVSTPDLAW